MVMGRNKNYQVMKLEKQKYLFRSLNEMKNDLYREINEKIEVVKNDLCPDIFQKPLYEVEKLPSRIHYGLITFERSIKRAARIENLSKLKPKQFKEFLKIKNFGEVSLKEMISILSKYGVDIEL